MNRAWVAASMAVVVSVLITSSAEARDPVRVAVLGVAPADGTHEEARAITRAFEAQVRRVPGWELLESSPPVESLAQPGGCARDCLSAVAGEVGADVLLHGAVDRATGGVTVVLHLFDARTGRRQGSIDGLTADRVTPGRLAPWAHAQLITLSTRASVEGSERATTPVSEPSPHERRPLLWMGVSSIAASALFWGMSVASELRIRELEQDLRPYRLGVDSGANACRQARHEPMDPAAREARGICASATRWERTWWASVGSAVATGVLGTTLLLKHRRGGETGEREPSLAVTPAFGPDGALLRTDLRF